MKKTIIGGALAAALLVAAPAQAEMFTYEITWGTPTMYGGIGPEGGWARGGIVEGTFVSTYPDRTVEGTVTCVGQNQPPSAGIFYLTLSCDAVSATGSTAIAYGCNYLGDPGPDTPMGCVGGIRSRGDEPAMGSVTMYWHSDTQANGTGQWYE